MNARNRRVLEILLVFLMPLNEYRVNHPPLLKLMQASSAKVESANPTLIPEPLMGTWVLGRLGPLGPLGPFVKSQGLLHHGALRVWYVQLRGHHLRTAFSISCAPKFRRVPQTPRLCVRAVSKKVKK